MNLTVEVQFHSDWGVGTGAGRHGSLDRLVRTDDLGLPMVPAKTLTGVLRDAAEQAAFGCDNGQGGGPWSRWVDWLFGSSPAAPGQEPSGPPRPAQLSVRPGYLDSHVRDWVRAAPATDDASPRHTLTASELTAATVIVRPGVALDRGLDGDPLYETGVARDDTLRMEQWARAGLFVRAAAIVPEPLPWQAQLLLAAACQGVTRMGGKRRRGLGRCTVGVDPLHGFEQIVDSASPGPAQTRPARLLKLLAEPGEPPPPTSHPVVASGQEGGPATAGSGEPLELRGYLDLTCLTPVCVAAGNVSNLVSGRDLIPGGALLPVVARAVGAPAAGLIRQSSLVVTDALPRTSDADGKVSRALPVPRPLQAAKRAGPDSDLHNALVGGYKPRHLPISGYLSELDLGYATVQPELVEFAHAVIDDRHQRPTEDSGGLFVMQALPAGTQLRAEVWAPKSTEFGQFPSLSAVGRSKKDDYGSVSVQFIPAAPGTAQPKPDKGCGCRKDGTLVAWLLSAMLLSRSGRPDPGPHALAEALSTATGRLVQVDRTEFATFSRIESWSSQWNLPRPSLVGLASGSVLTFTGMDCDGGAGCPWPRLEELAGTGIGQRRAEGFGRVRFNAAVLERATVERTRALSDGSKPATPGRRDDHPPDLASARLIWEHAWRGIIDDAAVKFAADQGKRREVLPGGVTKSQLGVLRGVVNALATGQPDGLTRARAWLGELDQKDGNGRLRNAKRAGRWGGSSGPAPIRGWLGVAPGEAGDSTARAAAIRRLSGALGISDTVLGDESLYRYARSTVLLHCITAQTRAKQQADRPAPVAAEEPA